VYEALAEYGEQISRERFSVISDERLELALLKRGERLINLGLASFASSLEVVAFLYLRSKRGTGDEDFDKAVRLACLGNLAVERTRLEHRSFVGGELTDLFERAEDDEVYALVTNPNRRWLLPKVLARTPPLDTVPDERWRHAVLAVVDNPALNRDQTDFWSEVFDTEAQDVREAVLRLLRTAPVEQRWLEALHQLILKLSPLRTGELRTEQEFRDLLARWQAVRELSTATPRGDDFNGVYTHLSLIDEFRCLVGALYGHALIGRTMTVYGTPEAQDVAIRCAYYGASHIDADEMAKYLESDGDAFLFAALVNQHLISLPHTRKAIEAMLRSPDLMARYRWVCALLRESERLIESE
jgi:hypothetical protein